ncbi:MAG: flagellin [candidate division Zixibacteria bacterium]|nr:flagellin [candidate division Zixibacteria bacterium]
MPQRITNQSEGSENVRRINMTHEALLKTMERLSSGWRIDRALDDPAGLVVLEKIRSRIASLNQDIENTTLMIRKYETAESMINELRSTARNLRVMVEAAEDVTTGEGARDILKHAAAAAAGRYNYLIETASYEGAKFFDGSDEALAFLPRLAGIDLSSPAAAEQSLGIIDQTETQLYAAQVDIGAVQKNDLETHRATLEITAANLTASESTIRDADVAREMAATVRQEILFDAGMALMVHSGVNRPGIISALFGD